MPLSEHEERILAEIERQLAAEDPRFARTRRRRAPWESMTRSRRVRSAVILGVLGLLAIAMLGIIAWPWNIISASLGMVALFGAILLGLTAASQPEDRTAQHVPPDERA